MNIRSAGNRCCRGGFTLVELLVVIAIIGILIGLLLLSFAGTLFFAITANRLSFSSLRPQTDFPDSILTEEYEWPKSAKIAGIANADGYAIAYSDDGYFAAFRNGSLHHMMYAGDHKCGIYRNNIFTVRKGTVYLYNAEGKLEKMPNASVLNDRLIHKGDQATISPYVYRIERVRGCDRIIAEKDGTTVELLTREYVNPIGYVIAAIICFLTCSSVFAIIMIKSIPDVIDVMRKYGKVH